MTKEEIAQKYAQHQLGFDGTVEAIGRGSFARVFRAGDSAIKVTSDKHDALACKKIMEDPHPSFVEVRNVFKVEGMSEVFIIETEVLQAYERNSLGECIKTKNIKEYFGCIRGIVEDLDIKSKDLPTRLHKRMEEIILYGDVSPEFQLEYEELNPKILTIATELRRRKVTNIDFHQYNVGWKLGQLKMLDFGYNSTSGKGLKKLEKIRL